MDGRAEELSAQILCGRWEDSSFQESCCARRRIVRVEAHVHMQKQIGLKLAKNKNQNKNRTSRRTARNRCGRFPFEKFRCHKMYLGGGPGRRSVTEAGTPRTLRRVLDLDDAEMLCRRSAWAHA